MKLLHFICIMVVWMKKMIIVGRSHEMEKEKKMMMKNKGL